MNAAVELDRVHKSYGALRAIDDVSLTVERGEVLGLLGHNGAGKTTLMKLILGLNAVDGGSVRVLACAPRGREAGALRRRIGYLPENVAFYEQLSGRETLRYFARLKRVALAEADGLLERLGLAEAARRRVRTYSKGMRQRLGLAQALLGVPDLLLLDEPTAGLDPMATRHFFTIVDELRARGATVLLSSHVLPGIERHVDRVAILGRGRLLAAGGLEELRQRSGLPLQIRARGNWDRTELERGLRGHGVEVRRVNGAQVDIASPPGAKLAVVRSVLACEGVEDIELTPPSLESLYASYFDDAARAGGDRR